MGAEQGQHDVAERPLRRFEADHLSPDGGLAVDEAELGALPPHLSTDLGAAGEHRFHQRGVPLERGLVVRGHAVADAAQLAAMLVAIYTCPRPVVARVQGDCYAGAMGLVAACDIAVAANQVQFCLSEVKLGLIPATISPYVIKAMGESAARRYFLTAERISAPEAQRIGFIQVACASEELDGAVGAIVKSLLANSPNAVREAKRLVRDVAGQSVTPELIDDTVGRIAAIRASSEGREGVRSFLEKRKPSWL